VSVRESEPWQVNRPGPFLTMLRERGTVTIQALGSERFEVCAEGQVQQVEGYQGARVLAHELAEGLGSAIT
jgi:hypothetical protein